MIHKRQQNAHLQNQWLESWYPVNNDTYAYVAEDDTVVSPYWYQYLKKLLMHYRYPLYDSVQRAYKRVETPNMYGISLQKQHLIPAQKIGKFTTQALSRLQTNLQPFMYPLIGSWGQLFFPEAWIDFRQYYDEHRYLSVNDEQHRPHIQGMVTDQWYRKMGEAIWTPWIIRWAYARGMYNMYANFPRTLAGNYREAGVNYDGRSAKLDFALITDRSDPTFRSTILEKQQLTGFDSLQRYDYCMRRVILGTLVDTSRETIEYGVIRAIVTTSDPVYLYNQMCFCEQMSDKVLAQACRTQYFYNAGNNRELAHLMQARGFNALYTPTPDLSWSTSFAQNLSNKVKSIAIIDLTGRLLVPRPSMDKYVSSDGFGVSVDNRVVVIDPSDARIRELLSKSAVLDFFGALVKDVKQIYPKTLTVMDGHWKEVTESSGETFLIKKLDYGCKALKCI